MSLQLEGIETFQRNMLFWVWGRKYAEKPGIVCHIGSLENWGVMLKGFKSHLE
jgi:hypothetical protein